MALDLSKVVEVARTQLGKPYLLGAKWDIHNKNPTGPIDCSGFVRWCYFQGASILIEDGSYDQFGLTMAAINPIPGDLGFFRHPDGVIHHVGLIADDENVIEARGDPFNAVILRPRSKWEAFSEFTGWRRLRVLGA